MGLVETRPSVDQHYEDVDGNQIDYPRMHSTPIQETNSEQTKKYENVPVEQVCKDLNKWPAMIANSAIQSSMWTLMLNTILFTDTLTMLDINSFINWEAIFGDNC